MTQPNDIFTSAFDQFRESPKEILVTSTTDVVTAAASPVLASRLNFTEVGVCPYCHQPMSRSTCCNQEVFLCPTDRFVSPLPNVEMTGE